MSVCKQLLEFKSLSRQPNMRAHRSANGETSMIPLTALRVLQRSPGLSSAARFELAELKSAPLSLQWPLLMLLIQLSSMPASHPAKGSTPSPVI